MKALIAMSGGVDSSVAAYLMTARGASCIGCTMRLRQEEDVTPTGNTCCSLEDVEDARSVAYRLGMPYYVFNFADDFEQKVIQKFIRCYQNGVTPNPCIDCNRYMKFDKLFSRAQALDCDCVVTGHYARIEQGPDGYVLKKATDLSKDQSYVLYNMTQAQLAHTQFPLGTLTKQETRRIAAENGFLNAEKPDSQDICFVPDGDYASVIEARTGQKAQPGDFVDLSGKVLGRHRGVIHYTIGQRRGLGLSNPEPLYVCRICPEENVVVLGQRQDLFGTQALVEAFHWISGKVPSAPLRCKAKLRYRQVEQWATLIPTGETTVRLEFDEPQRAITPGQAAVCYDGEIVLGGGVICA